MKKFFTLIFVILFGQIVYAFDVVYPHKNIVTINSPSTFFIGSSNPKDMLLVNGVKVKIHSSGGFAHVVLLEEGENKFKGRYFQGYLTEFEKTSSAEDFVECSLTFGINGSGASGDVTVTVEQQEVAAYVFKDTQKTGA